MSIQASYYQSIFTSTQVKVTLKINIVFENFQIPSLHSKGQFQKIKFEIRFVYYFVWPPKGEKLVQAKTFFPVSLQFMQRNKFCFRSTFTNFKYNFCVYCILKGQRQNFLKPCAPIIRQFLQGPTTIWQNLASAQFFSQKSLQPIV